MTPPSFPSFFRLQSLFSRQRIEDVGAAVEEEFRCCESASRIGAGDRVSIAIGSRGIDKIATVAASVVSEVKRRGGRPVIVPAMGSHGGATADGQAGVLAGYGITELSMGCPIEATMATVSPAVTSHGVKVHFDAVAAESDHVIVINRVKPHTRISGPYESGLAKMLLIGLGKHAGAAEYHRAMTRLRFDELVPEVVPILLKQYPIRMAIAIVENAFDEVAVVRAVPAEQLLVEEPKLLEQAKRMMPRLPFDSADLLIIDEIGKEFSGSGMDTNVVGRKFNDRCAGPEEWPKIYQIYVRGLSTATAGNASGIGIAEYCRGSVVRQMDVEKTRINCLTALHLTAAAIPVNWETDREVLEVAADQSGRNSPSELRWIWIRNTLKISQIKCSEAYRDEALGRADLQVLSECEPLQFSTDGQLL